MSGTVYYSKSFGDWTSDPVMPDAYPGRHRHLKSPWYERAAKAFGRDALFIIAITAVSLALTPKYVPQPAAAAQPDDELLKRLQGGMPISYVEGRYPADSGRFCITNPALGRGGLLAALGRYEAKDPESTTVVIIGRANEDVSRIGGSAVLSWSADLGAFVTPSRVEVGAGQLMRSGDKCG